MPINLAASLFRTPKMQEGRKLARLVTNKADFDQLNGEGGKPFPQYEGWSNSATWCFNLYFMQESNLQDRLAQLRRQRDGKINYVKAAKLMEQAQCLREMEQIDEDSQGPVNVVEIVDSFLRGLDEGKGAD